MGAVIQYRETGAGAGAGASAGTGLSILYVVMRTRGRSGVYCTDTVLRSSGAAESGMLNEPKPRYAGISTWYQARCYLYT